MTATPGVKGVLNSGFNVTLVGNPDVGEANFTLNAVDKVAFAVGLDTGEADVLYAETRTLAASANESLDLTTGLTTPLGGDAVFAFVKAIDIKAAPENTNDVIVGAAASNAFTGPFGGTGPTVTLPPGGKIRLTHPGAGWPVDSTHKAVKVANSAGTTGVDYTIVLIGTSAAPS